MVFSWDSPETAPRSLESIFGKLAKSYQKPGNHALRRCRCAHSLTKIVLWQIGLPFVMI